MARFGSQRTCTVLRGAGIVLLLTAILATTPLSGARAATPCQEIYEAAEKAEAVNELVALYETALRNSDCDQLFIGALGLHVARAMVKEIDASVASGASLESKERDLEATLLYGRLWQVLATLGDIAANRNDFEKATGRYQEALEVIDNPDTTDAPAVAVVEKLFRKAEAARLLADSYVAAPRDRAGEPSGLGDENIRGFAITRVAVPITFYTAEARFTPEGAKAADDLYSILQAQGMPAVTLVGHTDPRGTNEYNQVLSEQRVDAVKAYLLSKGYGGDIVVIAKGETEPFRPDDPSKYTQEQLWQMDRRVEVLRE